MKLKSGIKLLHHSIDFSNAIEINSGIIHHKDLISLKVPLIDEEIECHYEDDAYLPKREWRCLSNEENKIISTEAFNKDYNTIYLGILPIRLQNLFKELNLINCKTEKEVFERILINKNKVQEVNLLLNEFVDTMSNTSVEFLSIATNFANCESVSVDKRKLPENYTFSDLKFIGLHKDSSNIEMTIYTSNKFGNRLTINLGADHRYFLFVNLTILQIYNMLRQKNVGKENINNKNICKLFFEYFPDYPILKIKQKPYEYYIAPTDNCIHDGATTQKQSLDIVLTYLGHFKI